MERANKAGRWAGIVITTALLSLVGCAGTGEPATSTEDGALVHAEDSADPSVMFLRDSHSIFICTASLIGRRTGLTAAHCVTDTTNLQFCFSPCGNVQNCTPTCVTATPLKDPGFVDGNASHDMAVLQLGLLANGKDITSAHNPPIVPILIGGPVAEDEKFIQTGYGCTDLQDDTGEGQQRSGQNHIDGVQAHFFTYDDESQTYLCPGDSGGPAFDLNCQIGVMVAYAGAVIGYDFYVSRVDAKATWIQQVANDSSVHQCFQPVCGDGFCQYPEAPCTCPQDCGACPTPRCGDGICNGHETHATCPQDCVDTCRPGTDDCCGDGVCRPLTVCRRICP
jgi:Trypsin